MKRIFAIGISAITFILGGCSSTTITEYDKDGKIVSVTETDADVTSIIALGAKDKDNFLAFNGFVVGANPSTNTYGIGSFSGVLGSINKENGAVNAGSYATMINEAKVKLNLTADKDGIKAKVETNEASVQAPQEKKVEQ